MSKKATLVSLVILAFLALLSYDPFANAVLGLFLAGVIPGTTITIPYGLVILLNSFIVTLILVLTFVDFKKEFDQNKRQQAHKRRLPHRRYSHI